ncbi:MAG: DNA polymerase III subunit delta' [Alphaproteobacteria bacterium]|nr:DNA polymerase III subunit delta' [Alphaproteobacteria bacterium]
MILGHTAILERLKAAADRDGLHHAYLFEGPEGLGRRLVADWLARYVNCTSESRPCGRCPQCVRIAAGTHPDVIVLEPDPTRASQTIGVDAVREIIRQSGYHRYDSKRRMIIVDPADAMLEPAANALLKTLEEPPEGTGFVLLTTSARRLLPTIVSRCQRVRFGAVPIEAIRGWLVERGAKDADLCARLSLGSPGRALELADGGLEKRREARSTLLRLASAGTLKGLFDYDQNLTKGTSRSDWLPEATLMFEVLEELLRDVAVHASGANGMLLHADQPDLVADWSARLWPGGVRQVQQALIDARDQLEVNVNGRLVLDAVFTKLRAELGEHH